MSIEQFPPHHKLSPEEFTALTATVLHDLDSHFFGIDLSMLPAYISEKIVYLAAMAPAPATFSTDAFSAMIELDSAKTIRILEIASRLGYISSTDSDNRWMLHATAQTQLIAQCT